MKSLMKAKKVGRFYDGGEVEAMGSGDAPSTSSEDSSPAPERKQSFKEAFASAKQGSTFEWNGKKFKKEYAAAKPPTQRVEITGKRPSLSQGLGEKFAAVDRAHRNMPADTSPTAREALTKMRDSSRAAYEKAAESERTGKSVVKLANGGMVGYASGGLVKRQTAKSHGKAC